MIKLSDRLAACAAMVEPGRVTADVGTDHGYLALYLLQTGICPRVFASDIGTGPLEAARRSAERENVREQITFVLSDGLQNLPVGEIGAFVLAGMGGDTIMGILAAAPGVFSPEKQLILQPQSRVPELRAWLGEQGFFVREERIARDGKFLYTAMDVRWDGVRRDYQPGELFLPRALLETRQALLPDYLRLTKGRLARTLRGLEQARNPAAEDLKYYRAAYTYLIEMEEAYDLRE